MTTATATAPARLRLRNPGDVLAAVPYVLGFHPTDSLVIIGLRGKRFKFQVRGDLPPAGLPASALRGLADHYAGLFVERNLHAVILVGYGRPEQVTPMIEAVDRAMRRRGAKVYDMIRATDGRYWTYLCRNTDCCPADGTPYDPDVTAVSAAATVAGCVALPDRNAVVQTLAPPTGLALAAMERSTDRAADRLIDLLNRSDRERATTDAGGFALDEACARYAAGGRLDDEEVAWLSVLVTLLQVRDMAWRRIDIDGDAGRQTHVQIWTEVLRRCEPPLAAGPGMLLAYAQWRDGDLIRARVANERALSANRDYSAAQLMAQLLDHGVPPKTVPEFGADPATGGAPDRPRRRR